ncbi:hypothetical protein CHN50_20930 [Priestia aryabhattai]|nr:hypothetical protein CHN50_20930 [Priestia aryabhattai]
MSRGEKWEIRKTQLQKRFSRRNVDAAWKELAEKKYAIGFSAYLDGKKDYFYAVADQPFTQEAFEKIVIEVVEDLKKDGTRVLNLDVMQHSPLIITEKMTDVLSVQQKENKGKTSDVRSVQHKEYSTECTLINNINKEKEINKNINNNNNSVRDYIDNKLKEEFPNIDLDKVKKNVFRQEREGKVDISTDTQYEGVVRKNIEFEQNRVKRSKLVVENKPKSPTTKKKYITRKEIVPNWYENGLHKEDAPKEEVDEDFEEIKRKLKEELMQLDQELKQKYK